MIEDLKHNIETEIQILKEVYALLRKFDIADSGERKLISQTMSALLRSLKTVNNSIPDILSSVSLSAPLNNRPIRKTYEKISVKGDNKETLVTLSSKDKEKFLTELNISESLLRKVKKGKGDNKENKEEYRSPRGYLKMANLLFLDNAKKIMRKGYFVPLSQDIKKANLDLLSETYVAMIFFTMFCSFFIGVFVAIFFLFFNLHLTLPFITGYEGPFLTRLLGVIFIPLILPLGVFVALYFYPSTEKDSLAKKIDQELPFAVMFMGTISGSGIEPTQIFKIIGTSKEYPNLRKEIRKIINQINLYGYDLVTALKSVSKGTSSARLAELLSGLATTINSGGSLSDFLEKRAETLLVAYRLEREKYTRIAETFMDIYISIVIAAPMIMLLLLILLSGSKIAVGFTPTQLTIGIVLVIALINTFFLIFLKIKQPSY